MAPYLLHMGLYVINTTRFVAREEKNLDNFLNLPADKWIESAFAVDGPAYYATMAMLVATPERWRAIRVDILRRLILTAHVRSVRSVLYEICCNYLRTFLMSVFK